MSASVSKLTPIRQPGCVNQVVLQDIKKSEPETQAGSHSWLSDLTTKRARSYNSNREGKTEKDFAKVYMEHGIDYLIQAGKTKAGKVLGYLIKNMRFGNIAYVSPTTISRETEIDLPNVSRYLTKLCGDRLIVRYTTESGADAFFVSPAICFKGDTEAERRAKFAWDTLSIKYMNEQKRKAKLKLSGGRSQT